ncbi:ribose 5-phosphate isomerase B [bacterium]|nr:ribose 5-phosphate isomerase B [bacterium]
MKIILAADHGGFDLKEIIKDYLSEKYEIEDLGTYSTSSVDYPDYGIKAGEAVINGVADKAIVFCGTGIGISIAANKVPGIRAALCHNVEYAKLSRQHNDANILALGGRFLSPQEAINIVEAWLNTDFEGDRHQKRLNKINVYERKH